MIALARDRIFIHPRRIRRLPAILAALAALLVCLPAASVVAAEPPPASDLDLDVLAACIADSGARFYGAYWCPYCIKQSQYFGEHAERLPYVECYDGPKADGKNKVCEEAEIRGLPTWTFADGSRTIGALRPEELATVTGCL
jgi:hypothetical protein